ncbi:MAG: metal-sensitive transcriptional regulator [Actinobacteria bacterium]|nr:metal-sensitive transcriptional regulator [Actinomycetota bacterium]
MTEATAASTRADDDVERVLNRLKRIEGQVRGLQRMINEGKECEQVLTQLSAVKSALDRVGIHLISHRMKECLDQGATAAVDEEAMEQAFEIFLKYVHCVR